MSNTAESERPKGALPRVMSRCGDGLIPELEDTYLVKESAWSRLAKIAGKIVFDFAEATPDIDQGQQRSCTYSALLHCVEERRMEAGLDNILLAQCTGYAWDYINSSGVLIPRRNGLTGMALDFAIIVSRMVGGIPASEVDPLDYMRRNWKSDWKVKAYRNSVDEWRDCSSGMNKIVSSLCQAVPILHGWNGHSRMLVEFDTTNNRFKYRNTYGLDFGDKGFGWLSWAQVDSGRQIYGAFAPITVRDPKGEGDVPEKTN